MLSTKGSSNQCSYRVYSGLCPDMGCQTKLVFPAYESSIECTNCGQRHEQKSLRELQEVTDPNVAFHNMLKSVLLGKTVPKRGTETVKVLGLSNYHCKLLSHLLTRYGMDKRTGKSRLLKDLNQGDIFDCSVLGDRCFLIDSEHVDVVGYGRDVSGSSAYLSDTLATIRIHNGDEERLIPIHADGDGHCLVHAISRALVGRELFWHPLRSSLKEHFISNLERYKSVFGDFVDVSEWKVIVDECSPYFEPPDGELLGLRNIHVFGLANVLKRPIILLDSLSGMQSSADYAATFLPAFIDPHDCRGRNGELNKPLCIAWSSNGRNHYIPLVGIKNSPLPRLPRMLVPKAWGVPNILVDRYIEFEEEGYCVIGGDKCLQDSYILRLASAMEEVFVGHYAVHPSLVADVHHYIYKRTGFVGAKLRDVLEATQKAVQEKRLYVCLLCNAICEQRLVPEWFRKGGALYTLAEQQHGQLQPDKMYSFPLHYGVVCSYDPEADELVPKGKESNFEKCTWCQGSQIRLVNGDGSVQYRNGDRTKSVAESSHCSCGYKHYWDGQEYDNQPQFISVVLDWAGKEITEKVVWFQYESDPMLNSNVYEVTNNLVQKHFPEKQQHQEEIESLLETRMGVFGIERLVKKVVDQILEKTKQPEEPAPPLPPVPAMEETNESRSTSPHKIILSGFKVVHKEELTKSQTERTVHQKIVENARLRQRRRSSERPPSIQGKSTVTTESSSMEGTSSGNPPPPPPPVAVKMVRIVTSDGRQLRISMESTLSAALFLQKLSNDLEIDRQHLKKIMFGFPPKNLPLSVLDDGDAVLPFQTGDKVSVEVAFDDKEDTFPEPVGPTIDQTTSLLGRDSANILQRLQDLQNSNLDNLDASITSLMLTATLTNQNVWTHIQTLPNLFESGGLLYLQMKRDVGLVDGKHCRLSILPDKVFRYTAKRDRLELCLEPRGHFAVEPGIEEKVLHGSMMSDATSHQPKTNNIQSVGDILLSGSSGVHINKEQRMPDGRVPFFGQGYSLQPSSSSHAYSDVSALAEGGEECEEQMDMDSRESTQLQADVKEPDLSPMQPLLRMGPGYSVLNPDVSNFCNSHAERLQFLADQLEEKPDDGNVEDGHPSTLSDDN